LIQSQLSGFTLDCSSCRWEEEKKKAKTKKQKMAIVVKMLAQVFGSAVKERRVMIMGLDASGKTSILYRWKLCQLVTTIPTLGFNVETVKNDNVELCIWDVGGCDKIRPLWRHYFMNTQALVFVVDMQDRERIKEVREELERVIVEKELFGVPILLLLNKIDGENVMTDDFVLREVLDVKNLLRRRVFDHVRVSAKEDINMQVALDKLCEMATCSAKLAEEQMARDGVNEAVILLPGTEAEPEEQLFQVKKTGKVVRRVTNGRVEDVVDYERFVVPDDELEPVKFGVVEELSKQERQAEGKASLFVGWLKRNDEDDDLFLSRIAGCIFYLLFYFIFNFVMLFFRRFIRQVGPLYALATGSSTAFSTWTKRGDAANLPHD
jgi:small GTP-binding protein